MYITGWLCICLLIAALDEAEYYEAEEEEEEQPDLEDGLDLESSSKRKRKPILVAVEDLEDDPKRIPITTPKATTTTTTETSTTSTPTDLTTAPVIPEGKHFFLSSLRSHYLAINEKVYIAKWVFL